MQYPGVEAVVFFTVLYMGLCAYRVIFRIRIFNWYFMVPQHQTDAFRHAMPLASHHSFPAALCLRPSV